MVVIVIMAAAAPYTANHTAHVCPRTSTRPIGPAIGVHGPRALAGWAALVIAGLLLLVFLYRRRLFILLWTGGGR